MNGPRICAATVWWSPLRGRLGRVRGSVIVVVLVTVALAALMLVKFMEGSAVEIALAGRAADRDRLRAEAYGALETALAVMAEIRALDGRLHTPAQGWGDPYAYAGESPREGLVVSFEFYDESGKASLPNLDFEEMVALAEALGLSVTDARRFADGLFAWMREDYTPEEPEADRGLYERAELPHTPPLRSLRSWDELRAVRLARDYVYDETGALTAFGVALREHVSLYRFSATNLNAMRPALGVMRGWDEAQVARVVEYAAGRGGRPAGAPPWFRGAEDLAPLLGANAEVRGLDGEAKLIRVRVKVSEGASSFSLEAWVSAFGEVSLPAAFGEAVSAAGGAPVPAPPGGEGVAATVAGDVQAVQVGLTSGRASATARSGSAGAGVAAAARQRLNYPFSVLDIVESTGPDLGVHSPDVAGGDF